MHQSFRIKERVYQINKRAWPIPSSSFEFYLLGLFIVGDEGAPMFGVDSGQVSTGKWALILAYS